MQQENVDFRKTLVDETDKCDGNREVIWLLEKIVETRAQNFWTWEVTPNLYITKYIHHQICTLPKIYKTKDRQSQSYVPVN